MSDSGWSFAGPSCSTDGSTPHLSVRLQSGVPHRHATQRRSGGHGQHLLLLELGVYTLQLLVDDLAVFLRRGGLAFGLLQLPPVGGIAEIMISPFLLAA